MIICIKQLSLSLPPYLTSAHMLDTVVML